MSKLVLTLESELKNIIKASLEKAITNGELQDVILPSFTIEIPADSSNGDFSSNVALVGAKTFRLAPIKIAETLKNNIILDGSMFSECQIAPPGFINFFFKKDFNSYILKEILSLGERYGESDYGEGKKVNVEFVSANPTGPMHMGNARGGALGDCLSQVLSLAGFSVTREFYVNDAGNQIDKFALSLATRYKQLFVGEENAPMPEDCYQGEDIIELAKEFKEIHGDKYLQADTKKFYQDLVEFSLPKNISNMKKSLGKYRIDFDVWFNESTLHDSGEVQAVVDTLKAKGLTYSKEGAIWYKPTDEMLKDEVLVRKNGTPTYFTSDIAYHLNKINKRRFDKCIDIWGADHHGHVARLKSALMDCGADASKLDVVLMQLVRLVRDGEVVRMSKRTGKALQLEDLLEEVNVDAARFIFNMREANSRMDFDLDLAVREDNNNPVYYVQYAHARICSIIRKLKSEDVELRECSIEELNRLDTEEEIELIRHLSIYTSEIISAAKDYDPARITRYVITLANLFHKFYNNHYVKGEDESLMQARLTLCVAVKTVISNVLSMFKITAPESM